MLVGGRGADFLYGEDDNDTFCGQLSGTDVVSGGSGDDTFAFTIGTTISTLRSQTGTL